MTPSPWRAYDEERETTHGPAASRSDIQARRIIVSALAIAVSLGGRTLDSGELLLGNSRNNLRGRIFFPRTFEARPTWPTGRAGLSP
jgi:hypothetical protein